MQDLLDLALDRPEEARRRAEAVLAGRPGPLERSFACQCLGIVLRDSGRPVQAVRVLRDGLRAAQASRDAERERDVRATLGIALAFAGRTTDALRELERALAGAEGEGAAKIAMRQAVVLTMLGRYRDAAPVLRAAQRELARVGNRSWEARTRLWLANVELGLGEIDRAEGDIEVAADLLAEQGAWVDRLATFGNLAEASRERGDLARALGRYRDAIDAHRAASWQPGPDLVASFAEACLAAGLAHDAVELLEGFQGELGPLEGAEMQRALANARLAAGDVRGAAADASRAAAVLRRQGRPWFQLRARLTAVRCRWLLGDVAGLGREARAVAAALDAEGAHEASLALTLAGHLSGGGRRQEAWTRAASYRTHPNALVRAAAWHAKSLVHQELHDRGGVLRAAAAGLDAIDEHRRLIGSSELRALATTHGRDLTTIALRHAAQDPRTLLRWSERTRATALAQPPATSDAATIPASLAALRDNGRRLAEARAEGEPTDALERERLRLERAVRSESHTLSATTAGQQKPPSVEEIVAAVDDGCLVELVDVDGTLHVLVAHAGRVRRRVAGSTEEIAALLGPTQMLLRRASRGRATDMTAVGGQLQEAILGDAARLIPDGPVVLAPTARLHGLAWPLLPVLGDRPFSVVPSAGQWLRALATPRPTTRHRRTLLVSGPGLATGGAEVPLLAASHPDVTLLAGKDATLEQVLQQLDGADLVHLAAHGHFRADSPLFSALDLADGPLTVHDLERVRRAPYRVVLSACESGVLAPVGAEELLGLAAALFSLGTAGLVSSVAEVNDTATADLMVDLHAALATGADPATALHRVRQRTAGDAVAAGTAAAFLALGV